MNTIKLSALLCALLLSGCAATVDFKKTTSTSVQPVTADGRLQCKVYHLPEFGETPKAPAINLNNNTASAAASQKLALVVYIDQLRAYIGVLKGDVRTTYMRYLVDCFD